MHLPVEQRRLVIPPNRCQNGPHCTRNWQHAGCVRDGCVWSASGTSYRAGSVHTKAKPCVSVLQGFNAQHGVFGGHEHSQGCSQGNSAVTKELTARRAFSKPPGSPSPLLAAAAALFLHTVLLRPVSCLAIGQNDRSTSPGACIGELRCTVALYVSTARKRKN